MTPEEPDEAADIDPRVKKILDGNSQARWLFDDEWRDLAELLTSMVRDAEAAMKERCAKQVEAGEMPESFYEWENGGEIEGEVVANRAAAIRALE